jgi:hypothetical protein
MPFLGIYTKERMSVSSKDCHTSMYIAALVTKAKLWNQPKCPSTDEWMKKMWCIYIMEYYSVTKKDEIMLFAGK